MIPIPRLFPCQAFSQAGLKQGFFDTRGTMFFEIQRILARHRPSVFVLENVKQLVGHDKGQTLKTILGTLRGTLEQSLPEGIPMSEDARKSLSEKLNYAVEFRVLSSNNFGVPQKRERVFIIGLNRDKIRSVTDKDVAEIFKLSFEIYISINSSLYGFFDLNQFSLYAFSSFK